MSSNYSLYTIPMVYILTLMPHIYAISTYQSSTSKKFPLKQPRGFTSSVESDQSLSSLTKGRILRAEAAHANGMENIGLFAAAVVAGNAAGVASNWLNALSGVYLASRFVYNHVYIFQDLVPGELRSAVFFGGQGVLAGLFVLAGNRMR